MLPLRSSGLRHAILCEQDGSSRGLRVAAVSKSLGQQDGEEWEVGDNINLESDVLWCECHAGSSLLTT